MKKLLILLITLIVLGGVFIGLYTFLWTPENMAMWAEQKISQGDYRGAETRYEIAVDLAPDNHDYVKALLSCYLRSENYTKAERCLVKAIREKPSAELYCKLSEIYVAQNKILDSQLMLDTIADDQVRSEVESMRPAAPVFSHLSGDYDSYIDLSLSCNNGRVYYSMDGEYPSPNTELFTAPISLGAGTTTVRAIVISDNWLASPVVEETFRIVGVVENLSFHSPQLEAMLREQLYIPRTEQIQTSDLWEIESLKLPEDMTTLEDLQYFPALRELDAQGCLFEDYSPLTTVPTLESLNLSGHLISAEALEAIGHLTKLKSLNLSGCGISNITALAGLTAMEHLDLSDNSVRDVTPLSAMTGLLSLNLRANAISTLEPLQGMSSLQEFNISYNSITSLSPLQKCVHMQILHAENNKLISVGALGRMADLNIVVLSHNDLEDISPLRNCSRITELYVDNNLLTSMDAIEKMPLLQVLNCSHNQITVIPELPDMIYLKTFDAAYNLLSSVAPLAGLPELSTVNVDYNEQIEDIEILSSCPVLVQVNAFGTHVKEVGKLTDMSVIVNFDPSYADKADEATED